MDQSHGSRRRRRTFPERYKQTMVQAYDLASKLSPSAADALLRAEDVPLHYVNRWRRERRNVAGMSPMCDGCRGSIHFPRAGTRRTRRNRRS